VLREALVVVYEEGQRAEKPRRLRIVVNKSVAVVVGFARTYKLAPLKTVELVGVDSAIHVAGRAYQPKRLKQ